MMRRLSVFVMLLLSFSAFAAPQAPSTVNGSSDDEFLDEHDSGSDVPEEGVGDAEEEAPAPSPVEEKSMNSESKRFKGGLREKEAQGTKARNRFDAGTIPRSNYQLGGQPLEVDPD